jgi:hypothetical protein
MKRIYLALTILFAGTAGVLALNSRSSRLQEQLAEVRNTWQATTQQLAAAETEWARLSREASGLKQDLRSLHSVPGLSSSSLALLLSTNQFKTLTPEQRERLIAELGLSWNSSDQWLLVSKSTLQQVRMNAISKGKLIEPVAGVLGLTPEERQQIDAAFARMTDQYATWAKANVQREAPSGSMVARYTIPCDPTLDQNLRQQLFSEINALLGGERGGLLKQYSATWFGANNLYAYVGGSTSRLTVRMRKDPQGQPQLQYEVVRRSGEGQGSSQQGPAVVSRKYFPPTFKSVFPGGWEELAQREGFKLPAELSPAASRDQFETGEHMIFPGK